MTSAQDAAISLIWPDAQSLPVLVTNQILTQLSPGPDGFPEECVLTLGHVAPPILLGTPEEQQATLQALGAVSIKAHVRLSFNRARLGELLQILNTTVAQWDQAVSGHDGEEA